tara:strand:- start:8729 stop:9280 length:552 start_codon:yes stop_codon:yes gene_type:complete
MELKYVAEMQKHNLEASQLPDDAKTGIEQIGQVTRAINMLEAKGKNPTKKTLQKLKAMDKWVSYEIIDFANETDKNADTMPVEVEDFLDDLEDDIEEEQKTDDMNEESETIEIDPRGANIENELSRLYDEGNRKFEIEDLQSKSTSVYDLLFDTYEPDEDNGIETSRFKLIERNDGLFYLTKK